ncbi:MAG: hypothetical protein M1839_006747 [Geoglossum umbratile]|nr:MAG: hypothetical protein M1839_006747 [Geoglossum umbratile]
MEIFANTIVIGVLRQFISFAADLVVPVITSIILWRFNNAWLHKVVSKPSQKSWLARVREQKRSMAVYKAISLWACCRSIAVVTLQALLYLLVVRNFEVVDGNVRFNGSLLHTVLGSLGIYALTFVLGLLLIIPIVILARIQVSVLPENDEGIVPLDNALYNGVDLGPTSGSAASRPTAGDYKPTLLSAWRSFVWPARISLVKLYIKCSAIQAAINIVCAAAVFVVCLAID